MPSFPDVRQSISLFNKARQDFIIHDAEEGAENRYYGYLSALGTWIVMKQVISTGTHRYCVGKTGYAAAWTGRAGLTYGYFNELV